MGHAVHFLQRLERISPGEVDLAMSLYRDAPLVALVLGEAKLPETAERAAIALRHAPEGPHLVVARDGGFVTCLGEGMSTGELPIISRAKLDSIGARAAVLRERLQQADRALKDDVTSIRFFRKLATAAHEVSREDIQAAMGLAPMLCMEYLRCVAERLKEWGRARAQAEQADRDRSLANAPQRYWELNWALGHFTLLMVCEPDMLETRVGEENYPRLVATLVKGVMNPSVGSSARALWGLNRVGKRALPSLKQAVSGADPSITRLEATIALAVVGLGHAKLEAEVRKALPDDSDIRPMVENIFDHRDVWRERALDRGRADAVHFGQYAAKGSPWHFAKPEDVPEDAALAYAATNLDAVGETRGLLHLFELLPAIARAKAEELYLPQAAIDAVEIGYQPWMTDGLLKSLRENPRTPIVKAEQKPGRNDPCACGSGKKAKKCCGA